MYLTFINTDLTDDPECTAKEPERDHQIQVRRVKEGKLS